MRHINALRIMLLSGLVALLGACAAPDPSVLQPGGIYDPNEAHNRKVHAFNKSLDRSFVRPVSTGFSSVVPDEIEQSVSNFSENLSQPGVVVNSVLQGDLRGAGLSTVRFLTNTVLGFGGLFDVARDFDMPEHDTDFGETLHVWGVGEGAYVELPFTGPSTQRDAVGSLVDLFTNPLSYNLPEPERYYGTAASIASRLSDRGRFAQNVDSVLYDSADSYAQARLIYLQNRRFELGAPADDGSLDPYGDDLYLDPYEDPYVE